MMTSREFRRLVVAVSNGYAAADKRVDAGNREEFLRHGKWALGVLKRYFHDTDRNIERWLQGEKCVFIGAAKKLPRKFRSETTLMLSSILCSSTKCRKRTGNRMKILSTTWHF